MADDKSCARETFVRDLIARVARDKQLGKHEVKIKAITSGGANYTSDLFLVTLTFPDHDDIQLFAKVAIVGEQMRAMFDAGRLYRLEVFFYTKLAEVYTSLEAKSGLNDEDKYVFPQFFGSDTTVNEEVLVLENLVAKGYSSYNRFDSIDWPYASASVGALAKFHALSFAYQKTKPEEFKEVSKDLVFIQPNAANNGTDAMKEMRDKIVGPKLSLLSEDLRGRVIKVLERMGESSMFTSMKPGDVTVIAHGDYRASNLMYKVEGDKIMAIPVDYQTIHAGSPVTDLIYYEMLGSDQQFRAKYHDRLVDHYYKELSAALERLDVDVDEVYPRALLDKEMKERLPYAVLWAMVILPVVLVDATQAPRLDDSADLKDFFVPPNDLFNERFIDIVEDLANWGLI